MYGTCDIIWRRVRATTVAVEKQLSITYCEYACVRVCVRARAFVCVRGVSYHSCNKHAPYSHLWPALLYNIFPHFIKKARFSKKKKKDAEHKMCVLIFSTTFV